MRQVLGRSSGIGVWIAIRAGIALFLLPLTFPAFAAAGESLGRIDRCKAWLRECVASEEQLASYGLTLPGNLAELPADRPLVLVVHGYNGAPEELAPLVASLRAAGHTCGSFRYPNDHRLAASAQLLSRELGKLAQAHPSRKVALVAYSMGGLGARECLENRVLDARNVEQLVLIATPNHGSLLAHYAIGTDVCEHCLDENGGGPIRRIRASFADGLSEATDDLIPGSPFLKALNARTRNPRVRYSLLLGTAGPLEADDLAWVSRTVLKARHIPWMDECAEACAAHVADLKELVAGQGDGAVALQRGQLDGVEDTAYLPFHHFDVTDPEGTDASHEVYAAVAKRLGVAR